MKWYCGWNFNDLINCAKGCYENFDNNDNEMRGDIPIPMLMYIFHFCCIWYLWYGHERFLAN